MKTLEKATAKISSRREIIRGRKKSQIAITVSTSEKTDVTSTALIRRKKTVGNAIASAALEGLKPSQATSHDFQIYIAGNMTSAEGIQRVKARYGIH